MFSEPIRRHLSTKMKKLKRMKIEKIKFSLLVLARLSITKLQTCAATHMTTDVYVYI